ncbi:MAG: acyltransferase, partial [Bdellovibrionales bacterium]|nr:acyltransferase [Bdellovibrionales bacterium]
FLLILLGLCLLSLQLAEVMVVKNATFNFYSPLGRLWEFGFGASLAYCELHFGPSRRKFYRHCLPLLGVGLIGYSILIFDGRTPHPSLYTTLPILGVGLVISFSSMSGVVGRVLSSKLLVWIGLLSYSIYLWHFPIFAFARMGASFSTTWLKAQWILLTMLASVVSYFLVEKPFRNQRQVSNWWFAALLVFFAVPTLIGVAIARESGGLWQRFNRAQQEVIKGFNEAEYGALSHPLGLAGTQLRSGELTTSCRMRFPREACRFGNEKVVYLGDSFVGQYERALVDSLKDWGLGFISFNYDQCPFVSDQVWFGIVPECSVVNEMRRNIIQNFDDKKVFIISANENQFAHPKKRTKDPVADGRNERIDGQGVDSSIAWESYFENIRWLVELGHKVVLIRAIPPSSFDGRRWLADNVNLAVNMNFPTIFNDTTLSSTLLKNHRRYQKIQTEGVIVINPSDVLCDKVSDRCMDVKQGYGPLYDYPPHLSYLGAALVAELIESKLVQHGWLSRSD